MPSSGDHSRTVDNCTPRVGAVALPEAGQEKTLKEEALWLCSLLSFACSILHEGSVLEVTLLPPASVSPSENQSNSPPSSLAFTVKNLPLYSF